MLYPNITSLFLTWVISLFFISIFAFFALPHSGIFQGDFVSALTNWDGGHFIKIAQFGYQEKYQYAFFPLYPILINFLNLIVGDYKISALLISFFCVFFGLQVFYSLLLKSFSEKIAENSVLFLLLFPVSFFFLSAYSESLFFLLAALIFYFLKKDMLLLATITAVLISATRITGLPVVLIFIISVFLKEGISRKNWYVLLSPFGFVLYCYYLYTQTGDPFYFLTAENHWQRQLSIPGINFWGTINALVKGSLFDGGYVVFFEFVASVFGLGLVLRSFRFLPISFSAYGLLSILFPLFTSTLMSMPRFLLLVFPIFITLAFIKNERIIFFYKIFCSFLLIVFTAIFICGYWVS